MNTLLAPFTLRLRESDVPTEFRGAVATFLTMAYILFANSQILAAAGVPRDSAIACTALAAGICCILMGVVANFPVALASGMGLNAVVAFQLASPAVAGNWQTAMGLVVLDGIVILALVLTGLREKVLDGIPHDLRLAIGAGIGLFIAFIGLVNARMVVVPGGTLMALSANPSATLPPVTYGSLRNPDTAVAMVGLLIMAVLMARRVKGALVYGILAATALGLALGIATLPRGWVWPSFATIGQADVRNALQWRLMPHLFAIMMVDFFDTLGTVTGLADEAKLIDSRGRIPRIRSILAIDSISAAIGGFFGVSSVTSYIESASGVAEGARTGLHSVFVGMFFLAAVFLAPVAGIVPAAATAPALILVGFLMIVQMARVNFGRLETAIPAFIILLTIPLTYSISHGIGYGFITYVIIQLVGGKAKSVHPVMYVVAAAFLAYFLWPGLA